MLYKTYWGNGMTRSCKIFFELQSDTTKYATQKDLAFWCPLSLILDARQERKRKKEDVHVTPNYVFEVLTSV